MSTSIQFRTCMGAILALFVVVRLVFHIRSRRSGPVTQYEGALNAGLRAGIGLAGISVLVLDLVLPEWLEWASLALLVWQRWVGVFLGFLSLALLVWVHRSLGLNFSSTLHLRSNHVLVTWGPYRWVRNPMYTAFYGIALSFGLASANWLVGAVLLSSLTVVMTTRLRREEEVLENRFGRQYEAWAARTGRFIPRFDIYLRSDRPER